MTPNEYQEFTATTAIYPGQNGENRDLAITYCLMGLTSEVGEINEKFKKHLRGGGKLEDLRHSDEVQKELSDVCWYLARLSDELGFGLAEVFACNVKKLKDRQARGVLHGEGDAR